MNNAHPVVVHVAPRLVVHTGDLAATLLGAFGLALALASLGWQAYTFFRSGSRIKVILRSGTTDGISSYVTAPGQMTDDQTRLLVRQGMTTPVIGVEVINAGRGPTSVTSVGVVYTNGAAYGGAFLPGSPGLPFRLEGETEQTWYLDARMVSNVAKAWEQTMPTGKAHVIQAQVRIAGRTKPSLSKNSITVL
jgi:hypothetical protein